MTNLVVISLNVFIFAFAVCGTLFLIFIGNVFTKSGTKTAYAASIVMKTFAVIMFLTYLVMHSYCIKDLYFPNKQAKTQKSIKVKKAQHTKAKKLKTIRKHNKI